MYTKASPLFLFCETSLHAGSGSDLGIVDLPIQRERHTSFPKIEASSLKGSIRERFEQALDIKNDKNNKNNLEKTFGPDSDTKDADTFAGALGFTDARLLLFPVKSMKGVFAWVTCPRILGQFQKDFSLLDESLITVPTGDNLMAKENDLKVNDDKVILEEYTFSLTPNEDVKNFGEKLGELIFGKNTTYDYWQNHLERNIVILSDDDFKDFVNLSTEVITRTKINNETGTVEDGALFTEEYLPQESIMYSLVLASPIFKGKGDERNSLSNEKYSAADVMSFFNNTLNNSCNNRIQTGGNATLGKGLIYAKTISNSQNSKQNG